MPRVDSHIKRTGYACWKTSKRCQDPAFQECLEMFSSLRGTNCKTTHYLLPCFFKLSALNGDAKAPAVDLLGLNTL